MAARIFLALSALLWLPYGLTACGCPNRWPPTQACKRSRPPAHRAARDVRGLQAAIGLLALAGCLRGGWTRTALVAIGTLTAGLGTARLLGVIIDGGFSSYTGFGLGFEWFSALAARWLLRHR